MELIYKPLLEIKLLNEFFLTQEDGSTLLDEPDQQKRLDLLEKAFEVDRDTMSRDIDFDFPKKFKTLYEDYGLKLLPTYSGCKLLIRVNKKTLPDNSLVFEPFNPLPNSLEIFIAFNKKNNLPDIYSNGRINRSVPASYFFSNEKVTDTKTFPFLVNTISDFSSAYSYEQGELYMDIGDKPTVSYYDETGTPASSEIKTSIKSFASENDRMLLPLQFYFNILNNTSVTQAQVLLKDKSDSVIKSFDFNQIEPLRRVWLDFFDRKDLLQFTGNLSLADRVFSLEASGNNGYAETKKIIFDDTLYRAASWGTVHIKSAVTNTAFNLLDADGFIINRRDPMGNWTKPPVFEIPVKTRLSNFRYINNKGKKLDLIPALTNFLNEEGNALISLVPVPLSHNYLQVPDNTGTLTKYLPNPVSYELKKDKQQRIYFDIPIPESDLFPTI